MELKLNEGAKGMYILYVMAVCSNNTVQLIKKCRDMGKEYSKNNLTALKDYKIY